MSQVAQVDLWGEQVEIAQKEKHTSLVSRFVCPPFSVLDTKQGYWKERKAIWMRTGIQGELGRELQPGGNHRKDYGEDAPSGGYSASFGKSGQAQINSVFGRAEDAGTVPSQTATSIFDPVLCELAYTWFCPPKGHVLDPFAGGSVRGIVAAMLDRQYTGVDLSARQVAANRVQAETITPDNPPTWIVGDSVELPRVLGAGSDWFYHGARFDFVFTCPPYFDLEVYSDDPADLSAKPEYRHFLSAYRTIIVKLSRFLRDNSFACFVVGDLRNKAGHYCNLPGDTITAFQDAGLKLYNEIVLLTSLGSLPIRSSSQFNPGRKVGKAHQNVLVFVKGDWRKAAAKCEQL